MNCGTAIGRSMLMDNFDYDTYGGGVELFGSVFSIPNREIYGVIHKTSLPKHGSP